MEPKELCMVAGQQYSCSMAKDLPEALTLLAQMALVSWLGLPDFLPWVEFSGAASSWAQVA